MGENSTTTKKGFDFGAAVEAFSNPNNSIAALGVLGDLGFGASSSNPPDWKTLWQLLDNDGVPESYIGNDTSPTAEAIIRAIAQTDPSLIIDALDKYDAFKDAAEAAGDFEWLTGGTLQLTTKFFKTMAESAIDPAAILLAYVKQKDQYYGALSALADSIREKKLEQPSDIPAE